MTHSKSLLTLIYSPDGPVYAFLFLGDDFIVFTVGAVLVYTPDQSMSGANNDPKDAAIIKRT